MAETQAQTIARLLAEAAAKDQAIQALSAKVAGKAAARKEFGVSIGAKGGYSITGVSGSTLWFEPHALVALLERVDEIQAFVDENHAEAVASREAYKLTDEFKLAQAERNAKRAASRR